LTCSSATVSRAFLPRQPVKTTERAVGQSEPSKQLVLTEIISYGGFIHPTVANISDFRHYISEYISIIHDLHVE